jgi:predicted phosphoribosyltransferase
LAEALDAPLDVLIARKLGAPGNPELAIGAVTSDGIVSLDRSLARSTGADEAYIQRQIAAQRAEIERRTREYRAGRDQVDVRGKTVILVDDGIATGATTEVSVKAVRHAGAGRLILAVPVAPPDTLERLRPMVDRLECPLVPDSFWAVGAFYAHFEQTTDDEVRRLLRAAAERPAGATGPTDG